MITIKLMRLEGFTEIFKWFFSARVHQCLRQVSIYLLPVFWTLLLTYAWIDYGDKIHGFCVVRVVKFNEIVGWSVIATPKKLSPLKNILGHLLIYRVDRQCLFFGNPPGIHLESTFWKVTKIIGKSSTSEKPFEGGFLVDSHPFSTRFRYWFSNFLKVDSQPFFNMDLATFQDFELDLDLHHRAANVDNCVPNYCVVEYNLIMTTKKYCHSTYSFYHANW